MALSDFKGTYYIHHWSSDLDQRWPERLQLRPTIAETIFNYCESSASEKIHLLELGPGAGHLAQLTLSRLASAFPTVSYTGIDINAELIQHTEQQLRGLDLADLSFQQANLNQSSWSEGLLSFEVAYSFQTLHDLGGYQALESVYRKLYSLIRPGGLLLNADFIVPFTQDDPNKPRRFPIEVHQRLLEQIGFVSFRSENAAGKLAVMTARRHEEYVL